MRKIAVGLLLVLAACQPAADTRWQFQLGIMEAFAEMVAAGVKPIALSEPLTTEEANALWEQANKIAEKYGVGVYREQDLVVTALFPANIGQGKEVFIFHTKTSILAYHDLKSSSLEVGEAASADLALGRRMGRLLGYPTFKVNKLLAENTPFKTLHDFSPAATYTTFYYHDLQKAAAFYSEHLGLTLVEETPLSKTVRIAGNAYLILADHTTGTHPKDAAKPVAIALLTDDLQAWYAYLQEAGTPIKYTYKPKENNAHDGFVAIDPEGYLLEFETFKQHPENERLMPLLIRPNAIENASMADVKERGFYGAVTWLYYQDLQEALQFYEEVIGLPLVVDQGWAKVYPLGGETYVGLVDERRGMHQFSAEKAVKFSIGLSDFEGWQAYAQEREPMQLLNQEPLPEAKGKTMSGIDPGGYILEFNAHE